MICLLESGGVRYLDCWVLMELVNLLPLKCYPVKLLLLQAIATFAE